MKLAIIAIGIPGSGKTTLLKPFAERNGFIYINRDEIREELFGEPHVQKEKWKVWFEADRRAAEALDGGKSVILDSTFTDPWKRENALEQLRDAGATTILGVVFDTPLAVAKERNAAREHVVNEKVLEMMYTELEEHPPTESEGFDSVITSEMLSVLEKEEFNSA